MIDKIKFFIDDYNPNKGCMIEWDEDEKNEHTHKFFYTACLCNSRYEKKRHFLRLLLTGNKKTEKLTLSVRGSLRKWYFQENSRKDLRPYEFEDCIKLISSELKIDENSLLKAKVTSLEVGVTLLLKAKFKRIKDCFVKYRNAKRNAKYDTTLYFEFKNYKLVIYDKFAEMNKRKRVFTENEKRINKLFSLIRFEVSVKKVSGTTFKGKYDTLEKIKNNWGNLPPLLEKYINDITFIDVLSDRKNPKSYNNKDYINHFFAIGFHKNGVINSIELFDKLVNTNNKSKHFKKNIDTLNHYVTDEVDLKAELLVEVRKKLSRLL